MTVSDYAELIAEVARESGKRASALADACDLARSLQDDVAAADYLGQMKGINTVLDIISEKLGEDDD